MKYDQKESGKRIYLARQKRNITQDQLASALNVHRNTISRIERGENGLSIDFLIEISSYLGVSTDYILTGHIDEISSLKDQLSVIGKMMLELSTKL